MQDVRDALAAGKTVTISQRSVTVANWTGTGYIITNPNTGSGSYLIGGGADGGYVSADLPWLDILVFLAGKLLGEAVDFGLGFLSTLYSIFSNIKLLLTACDSEEVALYMIVWVPFSWLFFLMGVFFFSSFWVGLLFVVATGLITTAFYADAAKNKCYPEVYY